MTGHRVVGVVIVAMALAAWPALAGAAGQGFVAEDDSQAAATGECGVNWTARTSGTTAMLRDAAWTGTQLVVVGGYVGGSTSIFTSPDGVTWTPHFVGASQVYEGVVWTGTQLVAVGWGGRVVTSPDGITWTSRNSGVTNDLRGATWTGTQLVAVGSHEILASPDGIAWTERTSQVYNLFHVTWTGTQLVAVGDGEQILTSPDGITWARHNVSTNFVGVAWTGTQLVAVGVTGSIATSPDGVTWTPRTSGTSVELDDVSSTAAGLVAVGWGGTILTSPDGITWTSRTSGTSNPLFGVASTGSQVVAVGDTGTIVTSPCGASAYPYSIWVPVVSHAPGQGGAQWRSDTGLLNRSTSASANINLVLHASTGALSHTESVVPGGQEIFGDIVLTLGLTNGSAALEIQSDQPLFVTSRTYNQQSSGLTFGQGYDGVASADCLAVGQTAWLPQLTQNGVAGQVGTYRTNVGITNTGSGSANVTLTLYDANGAQVWSNSRSYTPGQFYQYQEPYRTGAGRIDIGKGYATVTVNTGSGVVAYASVTDNGSSDPTTINMKR